MVTASAVNIARSRRVKTSKRSTRLNKSIWRVDFQMSPITEMRKCRLQATDLASHPAGDFLSDLCMLRSSRHASAL